MKQVRAEHFTSAVQYAQSFVDFINKAVSPFHAVREVVSELTSAGYVRLPEGRPWPELTPGQKAFFTRNDSSIIAFRVGDRYESGNGVKIIGAHTDSPNFQIKPKSAKTKGAFHSVGVQCYGGGLWHTWFDRELTVAGRVITAGNRTNPEKLSAKLVHVQRPLLALPSLCIHLRDTNERQSFGPNKESHLVPVIATQLCSQIMSEQVAPTTHCDVASPTLGVAQKKEAGKSEQSSLLLQALAAELNCSPTDVIDFDLSVIDTQPATLGGYYRELVHAPRIDNLLSCFAALRGLLEVPEEVFQNDTMVTIVAMFDHEEVGSESPQGAGGTMTTEVIDYISGNDPRIRTALISNSFLLSVDGAHAAHPNYMDKHEEAHRPNIHEGPVIKYNANVRYATNGLTAAQLKAIAKLADVPLQSFCVKNDSPCGTTIGPILSTLSGIRAVDVGAPMLSMHSIRETCGIVDVLHLVKLLRGFIVHYSDVTVTSD